MNIFYFLLGQEFDILELDFYITGGSGPAFKAPPRPQVLPALMHTA